MGFEARIKMVEEAARVLRIGGKARISPFFGEIGHNLQESLEKVLPKGVVLTMEETGQFKSLYDENDMKCRFPIFRVVLEKVAVEN